MREQKVKAGIDPMPEVQPHSGDLVAGWEEFGNDNLKALLQQNGVDPSLTSATCGPIAAAGLLKAYGVNTDPGQLAAYGQQHGLWSGQGMSAGDGTSMQALLESQGIQTQRVGLTPDVIQMIQNGVPVVANFPGHYMLLQGYNPETGEFFVGATGANALSGGGAWMTLEEMNAAPGNGGALENVIVPTSTSGLQQREVGGNPSAAGGQDASSAGSSDLRTLGQQLSQEFDVPFPILDALVMAESGWNPNATGDQGNSIGLLQNNMAGGRGAGYSEQQLRDPAFNLRLGLQEIAPIYHRVVAAHPDWSGDQIAQEVGRLAQRPAAGNEVLYAQAYRGELGKPMAGEAVGAAHYQDPAESRDRTGTSVGPSPTALGATTPSQPTLPDGRPLLTGNDAQDQAALLAWAKQERDKESQDAQSLTSLGTAPTQDDRFTGAPANGTASESASDWLHHAASDVVDTVRSGAKSVVDTATEGAQVTDTALKATGPALVTAMGAALARATNDPNVLALSPVASGHSAEQSQDYANAWYQAAINKNFQPLGQIIARNVAQGRTPLIGGMQSILHTGQSDPVDEEMESGFRDMLAEQPDWTPAQKQKFLSEARGSWNAAMAMGMTMPGEAAAAGAAGAAKQLVARAQAGEQLSMPEIAQVAQKARTALGKVVRDSQGDSSIAVKVTFPGGVQRTENIVLARRWSNVGVIDQEAIRADAIRSAAHVEFAPGDMRYNDFYRAYNAARTELSAVPQAAPELVGARTGAAPGEVTPGSSAAPEIQSATPRGEARPPQESAAPQSPPRTIQEAPEALPPEVPPSVPPSGAAREPWQMTRAEFRQRQAAGEFGSDVFHASEVRRAFHEGKPVPSEVLEQYPEFEGVAQPHAPSEPAPGIPPPVEPAAPSVAAGEPAPRDFAANINVAKFPEDVRDLIRQGAEDLGPRVEQARRGVIPDSVVADLAQKVDVNALKLAHRLGKAYNAEEAVALRNALDRSYKRVEVLARQGDTSDQGLIRLALARQEAKALQEVVHGATAEAGRSLRAFRQEANRGLTLTNLTDLDQVVKRLGGREELRALMGDLREAAGTNDPLKLGKIIQSAKKPGWWEQVTMARGANLMSAPVTTERNLGGNISNVTVGALVENPIAALVDRALSLGTGQRAIRMHETGDALGGFGTGLMRGLKQSLQIMRHGFDPNDVARLPDIHGEMIGGAKNPYNLFYRFYGAQDSVFVSMVHDGEMRALAYNQARNEVVKGTLPVSGFRARVDELVAAPEKWMSDAAMKAAQNMTFRDAMDKVGDALVGLQKLPVVGRLIFPFIRTPYNITKYSLARSPLAGVKILGQRIGAQMGHGTKLADMTLTQQRDLAKQLSRFLVGTGLTITAASLYESGDLTGEAPTDPKERKLWEATGKQANSIKLGGRWYDWSQFPVLSSTFAMVTAARDARRDGDKNWEQMAGEAGLHIVRSVANQPYLQGWSTLTDALSSANSLESGAERLVSNLAGGFVPASSLLNRVQQGIDPTIYETGGDPLQTIRAAIPGGPKIGTDMLPSLDAFGQARVRDTRGVVDSLFNPIRTRDAEKSDPVSAELLRLGVSPRSAPTKIGSHELTDQERYDYLAKLGPQAKQQLQNLIASPAYQAKNDIAKQEALDTALSKVSTSVRNAATADLGVEGRQVSSASGTAMPYRWEPSKVLRGSSPEMKALQAKYASDPAHLERAILDAIAAQKAYNSDVRAHKHPQPLDKTTKLLAYIGGRTLYRSHAWQAWAKDDAEGRAELNQLVTETAP